MAFKISIKLVLVILLIRDKELEINTRRCSIIQKCFNIEHIIIKKAWDFFYAFFNF